MIENKELLKLYMDGFHDEAEGAKMPEWFKDDVSKQAYILGRLHYELGDDNSSIDNFSEQEILKEIKNGTRS